MDVRRGETSFKLWNNCGEFVGHGSKLKMMMLLLEVVVTENGSKNF